MLSDRRCTIQPVFAIRGFVPFGRVGALRPVRAIDEPWQDGDHVGTDDDKEELGGVPAAIWRGASAMGNHRAAPLVEQSSVDDFRKVARGARRSTLARVGSRVQRRPAGGMEAWEAELAMKAPHPAVGD